MKKLKNFSTLFLMILNISCTSLINPQEQPVNLIDGKANIYITTCSGLAETIGTCHAKAKRTCQNGYEVLKESLDSSGVHREIKFQCK
jgi:hypothetical protein